jgi:hypothetical protein
LTIELSDFKKATSMNPSPISVPAKLQRKEDLVYQVVTVVAMVSLLASVWIF